MTAINNAENAKMYIRILCLSPLDAIDDIVFVLELSNLIPV
jgi:hypothetical protein